MELYSCNICLQRCKNAVVKVGISHFSAVDGYNLPVETKISVSLRLDKSYVGHDLILATICREFF